MLRPYPFIGLLCVLILLLAACSTQERSSEASAFQVGSGGTLPGVVGSLGAGTSVNLGTSSQPLTLASEAPLGLDEAYSPNILHGASQYEDTRATSALAVPGNPADNGKVTTSRSTSVVVGGGSGPGFDIIDLTMEPDGVAPDWTLTHQSFLEGQAVDLWIKYQMNSTANVKLDRHWDSADIGLNKTDSQVTTPQGLYTVKLDWTVPLNSAKTNAVFKYDLAGMGLHKYSDPFYFDITKPKPTSGFDVIDLTMMPDGAAPDWSLTHAQFHEGDKIDLWIQYELYSASMIMDRHWLSSDIGLDYNEFALPHVKGVYKVKLDYTIPYGTARNNAVFKFDVTGASVNKISAPFYYDILSTPGTGTVVYPIGGDGDTSVSGYSAGWAQMVAEDLLTNSDYDFNDFVGRMQATEYRNSGGNLTQIKLRVKAIARGAGYDAAWQLNFGSAFPGATAWAKVDQYYANGTRHGNEVLWQSSGGVSIPVFSKLRDALPEPPTSFATNTVSGTKYIDGDYADVLIFFNSPVAAGSYTPLPYQPELRVQPPSGSTYTVSWSTLTTKGWHQGTHNSADNSVLAFIVPDTFAWPLEGVKIWDNYPGFLTWAAWMNSPNAGNTDDPNTYLVSPAPTTAASQFGGSPQPKSYWTSGNGANEFHNAAPPNGQLTTTNLLKYLSGDPTVTALSVSKVVLSPLKSSDSNFTGTLPLPLTNIDESRNTSTGYTQLKNYLGGASSAKPIGYQLGAELTTLVLNVERGRISPDEWTYIPELGQIRAVVADSRIASQTGVISAANAAFALPASTQNDAVKTIWFKVCQRLNANTYFVKDQPQPEPLPHWYDATPTGSYFKRSLFQ